jgi:hypothetical protein
MGIERQIGRALFHATELVELKQMCFTPGRIFAPGRYRAEELPDTAFDMGLVQAIGQQKPQEAPPELPDL